MPRTDRPGRLAGRCVLITGASRGIGRSIALRFAEEGADLMLSATNEAKLQEVKALAEAEGARALVHAADVTDPAAVDGLMAATLAAFGRLDVLVNNAGIYKAARFTDYALADLERVMRVNVYSAFQLMQLAIRQMQGQGYGKIVNMASTAGKWESMNQAVYNASKHALVGLTRCAALETAAEGITVNAICPGFVETDMLAEFDAHAAILGVSTEQLEAGLLQRVPMKRWTRPEEVAHIAVYLSSAESDGMTGQTITISGGMRMG